MNRAEARAILSELERRVPIGARLHDKKFPDQTSFVEDPNDFVAALCSRRAGKSRGLAKRALRAMCKHRGFTVPYIGLTRESAYNIMWPTLFEVNREHNLGAKLHESDLRMELPNGSNYKLFGADMKNFIERLRGGKYSEAQIDEAQSFRSHISTLVDDVLGPALADLRGATVLSGTPGPIPSGLFYDASHAKYGYSVHKWTVFQNPYFPDPVGFVRRLKEKKGWTDENPTYQREWLGQWVLDLDALVYKFNKERNVYDELPGGHDYLRILSVDYGWNDATAFAIVSYSHSLRHVFVEHVEGHSELIPADIAQRIIALQERFRPVKIVADTGGLGKSITEEFVRRYSIPIHPAEKKEKLTNIRLLNGDFIDGNLSVHSSLTELHDQYATLVKGDDGMEDPTLPNDLCDAVLYGYREAKHYLGEIKEPEPAIGTKRWADKEAQRMLEREAVAFEEERAKEWWEQ